MPETSSLALFSLAAIALLVVPGPAVLYIVARSIDQGRAAGFASVMGVHAGSLFHIGAAALGLSAILVSSSTAFNAIKYAGAAYLILLGIRKIRARNATIEIKAHSGEPLGRIFRHGVVVNVLNPKTALFFFAFLPQFVSASRGSVALQIMILGLVFVTLGLISDGAYALLAARVGRALNGNPQFASRQSLFSGSVYLILGVLTAVSGSKPAQT
jgi:threonine/homoserine/homoserine lactone efflux protein